MKPGGPGEWYTALLAGSKKLLAGHLASIVMQQGPRVHAAAWECSVGVHTPGLPTARPAARARSEVVCLLKMLCHPSLGDASLPCSHLGTRVEVDRGSRSSQFVMATVRRSALPPEIACSGSASL